MMTSALLMSSCITAKRLVPVAYAFASEVQFGTVQKESGDKGFEKPDTVIIIYAEATRDSIQWENVVFQNREYSVFVQRLNNDSFEAGFLPETGKPQIIKAANGRMLYQLQLQSKGKLISELQASPNTNKPVIQFNFKNKTYNTSTNEPVFLLQRPAS